jgi:excisionase family DNA binding protein
MSRGHLSVYADGAAALARARERSAKAAALCLDDWLTPGEAGERVGVSLPTIQRAAARGDIESAYDGDCNKLRIDPLSLERWARRLRLIA